MKTLICSIIIFFITSFSIAQTEDSIDKNKKAQMVYYKHKMTPQPENFVDTAPACFTQSIQIKASIEKIWSIIDDTPNFTKWFPGLVMAKMINPTEKGIDSKRIAETKKFNYYETIIAYEENKKWGFTMLESTSGAFESITEMIYLKEIDAENTEVIYKGGYQPKGILKLLKGVIAKNVIKAWRNALESLKKYAEEV